MYGYIYETTNLINGKKYIGKKKSSKFLGEKYLGSGIALKRAVNKYGKENFSIRILEEINKNEDYKYLSDREIYYIELFDAVNSPKFYNNSYGGENEGWEGVNKAVKENPKLNGMYGKHHSEKTKRLISKQVGRNQQGENNAFYGKHHSEKSLEKIRWKNSKSYNQRCKNISIATKLAMQKPEVKEKMIRAMKEGKANLDLIWVNDSKNEYQIDRKELYKYNNYNVGRLERVWINKDGKSKFILKNKLNEFIEQGYKLGRR